MGNEKTYVENPIKEFLNIRRLNGDRVFSFKQYQTSATIKGISDLSVCIHGMYVATEVKDWGKEPSIEQMAFGRNIMRAGGVFVIVDDAEKFKEWYFLHYNEITKCGGEMFDLSKDVINCVERYE